MLDRDSARGVFWLGLSSCLLLQYKIANSFIQHVHQTQPRYIHAAVRKRCQIKVVNTLFTCDTAQQHIVVMCTGKAYVPLGPSRHDTRDT